MDQVEPANGQYSHISEERYKDQNFIVEPVHLGGHVDHLQEDHVEPVHLGGMMTIFL